LITLRTPATIDPVDDARPSERCIELAVAALDHICFYLEHEPEVLAMLIADTDREPVMPLHAREPQPANRGALMVLAQDPEGCRSHLRSNPEGVDAYAVVFDALLNDVRSGGKVEGVIAEVGVRGEGCAFRFAQRYQPKRDTIPFRRIGDIIAFEQVENLLG
jgi:hypothetical protein